MDKVERLIREYLEKDLRLDPSGKTADCLDEQALLEYLEDKSASHTRSRNEHHIAGCGFCLSNLSLLAESRQTARNKAFTPAPQNLIDKTKSLLGIDKDQESRDMQRSKTIKKRLFLAGTIISFALSFFIPRYFMQFLAAALILGIRWSFESESGRTLIMVFDSWRRNSRDKDDEISRRMKSRF